MSNIENGDNNSSSSTLGIKSNISDRTKRLATIEVIDSIKAIDGSDNLDVATVCNVPVCVSRGEFKENEKVILIRSGSVVAPKPEFKFLEGRHYTIKRIKLRGQWSEGVLLPLNYLPAEIPPTVGMDVTNEFGITPLTKKAQKKHKMQSNKSNADGPQSETESIVISSLANGLLWGVGLVAVKVVYGLYQGYGVIESIFSQNGLIVFAIGFGFGIFNALDK